jgi:hypothetical protein
MRWTRQVERVTEKRNAYKLLEGKSEGKRQLGLGVDSSGSRYIKVTGCRFSTQCGEIV